MTFQGDPHRILGLAPGASLNEIRSAYRRLVKQYHPDAAGERALPRFLAIQAAYERLVDGEGRLRPPGTRAGRPGPGGGAQQAGEPWRADPARARASRDAWRARRSADASRPASAGAGEGTGAGTGTEAPGEGAAGGGARPTGGATGRRGDGGRRADGTRSERPGRRDRRKATQGSTTYDEAAEIPLDPEWDGGAWYGPTSGTYWTLNPREYADPRKHGPEYLARARRAARPDTADGADGDPPPGADRAASPDARPGAAPEPTPESDVAGEGGRWRWSGATRTTTDGGAAEWGTRAWTYDPRGPSGAAWTAGATGHRGARPAQGAAEDGPPLPDLETLARRAAPRNLLALARHRGWRWRLLLALAGWPPIGFAAGTLLATVTGCATFSAACPEPMPAVSMAVQPLVVLALLLVPPAAAAAAFGSLVALVVALPVAAVLSVGSGPESRVGAPVLGALTGAAYLVALAVGSLAVWRAGPGGGEPGP